MTADSRDPRQSAFRATFLLDLDPRHAETLRRLGGLLEELFRNLENDAEAADLRLMEEAWEADLRHLVRYLSVMGRHRTASQLSPEEGRIAERAGRWAEWLRQALEEDREEKSS